MTAHRIMLTLAFLFWQGAGSLAAAVMETGPGCGLGAMLWADSAAKKHIVQQSMIATTNGIGSQTFAISSGTSGCTNDGVIVQHEKVNLFVGINFEHLKQEMAQGQGEHLASLATLMGVPAESQPEFFSLVQDRYRVLIPSVQTSSVAMLKALYGELGEHPVFAKLVPAQ